jgi:hypothetical protein
MGIGLSTLRTAKNNTLMSSLYVKEVVNMKKVSVIGLGILLLLVVIGVNPLTWQLFEPELNLKQPSKAIIAAQLHDLQVEETITFQFLYKQGVNQIEGGNFTLHLDRDNPRGEALVELPGAGKFTYKVRSTTILDVAGVRLQGTGASEGTVQIKGETKLWYGINASNSRIQKNPDGNLGLTPYALFLQSAKATGGREIFDREVLRKGLVPPAAKQTSDSAALPKTTTPSAAKETLGTIRIQNHVPIRGEVVAFIYLDGDRVRRWPSGARVADIQAKPGPHTIEIRAERPVQKLVERFELTVEADQIHTWTMQK